MAEVLGQRRLLGVGMLVVAWLVLFHLLVNIWLLCIFTSLLVVLGGWLGSQAALDSNTVLHLERFITMDQITPSEEDEEQLDQEIHNTVRKIIRDFVTSWYSTVSAEKDFESEVHDAMIFMAMELKRRARIVDRKELTQRILDLFGCHLQDFLKAKQLVPQQQRSVKWDSERLWRAYSGIAAPHVAMTSKGLEINYMRALVDLLLHVLVPSPHLETRSGRFVVGELITCNVMLPLMDKLSDPDWLNLFVIELFGKRSMQVDGIEENIQNPTPPFPSIESETSLIESTLEQQQHIDIEEMTDRQVPNNAGISTPEFPTYFEVDSNDLDGAQNTEDDDPAQSFLRHCLRGSKLNPFYQETDSDLDSPLTDYQQSPIDSLVMIGQEDGDKQNEGAKNGLDSEDVYSNAVDGSCPKVLVNSQPVEDRYGCLILKTAEGAASNIDKEGLIPPFNPSRELLLGVEQTELTSPNELTVVSPSQMTSPLATFSFEPLSSPEGPVIIQNLRITGTITAKEHRGTGSHPYTLYTIKYETAMGCENQESAQPTSEEAEASSGSENSSAVQQIAYHMVNRRYSEFLNLQTRLEERADLRKLIKGVKGPKKIFPDMPFGNMDSDKIEARKGLLATFLQQLCAIPEIANSEEMQEFLALNTDARIAFVKKPFISSRIDKIVVNAIVDTLKTAFPRSEPQSPTDDIDEADGVRLATDKKNKSRLKFSTKNLPLMNGSDVRASPLFSVDHNGNVFNGMTLGDLEVFINDREKLALRQDSYTADSPIATEIALSSNNETRARSSEESVSEMALAEVTLNILCLLMREQWSWLCTENIQRTVRLLFGTLLNRILDVSVANLLCVRYWVTYLQVIQEAVWPGGMLPTAPEVVRTQQQKDATKQEALQCLMQLLPDLISDMLGSDKYKVSWQNALDALQDPYINRHLVYCIFDLLLEHLVPETAEEDFQRSLLQSLSKVPEKIQA